MRDASLAGRKLTVPFFCLPHLLQHHAKRIPDAPAILAPGRPPLTYGRLYQHIESTGYALQAMGIGRSDRIAVVLPNGPEMAVTILAAAATAVCAPINPAYQAAELERYFADLRPRALITQAGIDSPARRVALSHGVRVIELSAALDATAGLFTLIGARDDAPSHESISTYDSVSPDQVAVLLLTSGTTARPKIVPQTHANICTSAYSSVAAWALTETDRCINMLPLFHGHGLHNTLMASLAAGASVACTPGWDPNSFFDWLTTFRPTWYSAVAAIHKAILDQVRHDRKPLAECPLRFVRSGSAPLPSAVLAELESTFGAPVIEFYAMTETTSTPIACNPLPPGRRKTGSAGIPVSLDVEIMDEAGGFLGKGRTGEVVVRGAGVMHGYDGHPIATKAAFADDWFRTGDLGHFDNDGYLFLAGRVREVINRGGEKITPPEVDEVLLQHPAVAEAVSFAMPHATLGEDVAAAVVLRANSVATPKEIRRFATGRLADFKVPRQVFIVGQIPKGPTGKVQRMGLAAILGVARGPSQPQGFVAPRTPLEELLARRWAEILQLKHIGVHDDFFASGGDSLLATYVLVHVYELTNVEFDISKLFEAPTVAEVASHLEQLMEASESPRRCSALIRVPRQNGVAPASLAQERFWKLQHALPDLPFFNILYALRITSPCDPAILERSLNEIARRHEILRTTLAIKNGKCVQVISPQRVLAIAFDDLLPLRRSKREAIANQLVQEEVLHSFDLTNGPLVRARLLCFTKKQHLLLISMHQAICDGWSLGVLLQELIALYDAFHAGVEHPLAPLSLQYADFALWQRCWESNADMVAQLAYWREQLRGPLPPMSIGKARPKHQIDDLRTARVTWALPARLAKSAKLLARNEGATLFIVLVGALKTLLRCYLGHDDIRVATNVANRNRAGTTALIGPFVNTLILRTNLAGNPTSYEVLRRVRGTALAAFARQDLPLELIARAIAGERGPNVGKLANTMILLHNSTLRPTAVSGQKLAAEEANPSMMLPLVTPTDFDVILMLHDGAHGLKGTCVYKQHLFDTRAIDRLLRDYQQVLEGVVTHPDRPISAIELSLREWRLQG
jgi:acyl-CoA synthetase (AMP-forming)/AMP-acid ligase II